MPGFAHNGSLSGPLNANSDPRQGTPRARNYGTAWENRRFSAAVGLWGCGEVQAGGDCLDRAVKALEERFAPSAARSLASSPRRCWPPTASKWAPAYAALEIWPANSEPQPQA